MAITINYSAKTAELTATAVEKVNHMNAVNAMTFADYLSEHADGTQAAFEAFRAALFTEAKEAANSAKDVLNESVHADLFRQKIAEYIADPVAFYVSMLNTCEYLTYEIKKLKAGYVLKPTKKNFLYLSMVDSAMSAGSIFPNPAWPIMAKIFLHGAQVNTDREYIARCGKAVFNPKPLPVDYEERRKSFGKNWVNSKGEAKIGVNDLRAQFKDIVRAMFPEELAKKLYIKNEAELSQFTHAAVNMDNNTDSVGLNYNNAQGRDMEKVIFNIVTNVYKNRCPVVNDGIARDEAEASAVSTPETEPATEATPAEKPAAESAAE